MAVNHIIAIFYILYPTKIAINIDYERYIAQLCNKRLYYLFKEYHF